MNKYECLACGQKYQTEGDETPPGIHWSDGHVCEPISVNLIKELDLKSKIAADDENNEG